MFWQQDVVREGISMTLNSDYELDLPENGLLGSIMLRLSGSEASGYGQSGGDWRIIDELDLVEIVLDSTKKAKSLTGYQAQALAAWDTGLVSLGAWRNYATNTQWEYMLLNFGRHMYDTEYGLDLSQYNNVSFKLSNTATSSDFSGLSVTVIANYLRDAPARQFKGFMKSEQWRSWTTVQDETQYNNLPTELMLRRIMLQAIPNVDSDNVESTGLNNLMDNVKLALDSGETLIYEGGIDDIIRMNAYQKGSPFIVVAQPYHSADKGIDISLGYVMGAVAGAGSQDGAAAATIATLQSSRTSFTQKMETYEADSPANLIAMGVAPYGTVLFPFDYSQDPATWLNPEHRKQVKLDIHTRDSSSAADGLNAIVLERLQPYR